MRRLAPWTKATALAMTMYVLFGALSAFASPGDTVADRVFGQAGSFTANGPSNPSLGAGSLFVPSGVAMDSSGHLYVADGGDNRVLEYDSPLTSQAATRVFGQGGSFTSNAANNGGVSASSLHAPASVAVDGAGHLYIADDANHRVLEYDTPLTSQTATHVFGQGGGFSSNTPNNGGVSASSLDFPSVVAADSAGRLYVADYGNNRVLEYDTPLTSQTATHVFGQEGSYSSNTPNNGGVSASSLSAPFGAAVDTVGRLYVGDAVNNRVLEYDSPLLSQTATRVLGQGGSFSSNTPNNGGIGANTLYAPSGVAVDSAGRLYVADNGNNRVLEYDTPLTSDTATRVFGQGNSFISNALNGGGVSANGLYSPFDVTLDSAGNLYIADDGNNRVLEYDSPAAAASVGGIAEQPDVTALPTSPSKAASGGLPGELALGAVVLLCSGVAGWYVLKRWQR